MGVVTDGGADLPDAVAEALGIRVVGGDVRFEAELGWLASGSRTLGG